MFPALLAGEELLHAIHGPDGALGHRQAGQPGVVAGFQILVPGVADEVVLFSLDAVVVKDERLIGHHPQLGDDAVSRLGDLQDQRVGRFGRIASIVTSGDV